MITRDCSAHMGADQAQGQACLLVALVGLNATTPSSSAAASAAAPGLQVCRLKLAQPMHLLTRSFAEHYHDTPTPPHAHPTNEATSCLPPPPCATHPPTGELMSFHKPMSPWSGQEVTHYNKQDSRLPLPLPDPYGSEPPRPDHRHLITRTDCPFTAEPNNVQLLQAGLITPTNLFYIRDHLPAPHLAAAEYSLTVEGPGVDAGSLEKHLRVQSPQPVSAGARGTVSSSSSSKPGRVTLTLQDLAEGFQHHSIVATLQCAGNRRNDMRRYATRGKAVLWGEGGGGGVSPRGGGGGAFW
jgi:hypothetical protein